jgi:rod shape-determining protein MreC
VLDEFGVVGQVTRVFASDAEVTLVTDKDLSLPVQVVRNGLHAVAFGGGDAGGMELRFLPANADVVRGDAVVTSGLDGLYPPGLPVGQVERVEHDVKDQFARIVVRPVAGLARGRTLLVLLTELPALARRPEEERRRGPETTDRPARRPGVRG